MRKLSLILLCLALVTLLAAKVVPERYLAFVVLPAGMESRTGGGTTQLNIYVNGYTSDEQMNKLRDVFDDGKNPDALLSAIQKMPSLGLVSVPGQVPYDIKIIRTRDVDGGREITMITDRPIGYWEAMNSPVTQNYPYGMVQFTVDKDGKGKGQAWILGKMKSIGPTKVVLDDYGVLPIQFPSITPLK